MKKVLLSLTFVTSFGAFAAYQYFGASAPSYVATNGSVPLAPAARPSADTPAPAVAAGPAPKPQPSARSGPYKDGLYTGPSVDAYYGNVEVEATVSGGQLTDVTFLDYPSDRSTSRFINGQATPILRSEAIRAQSAQVDIVSGATDTSNAFRQSLTSALLKARS